MGDRANVRFIERGGGEIYFYTHNWGSELPFIVQRALDRHQRWDDESYLARIIFCTMVGGDWPRETGFGISTTEGDNEHPLVVVDVGTQEVRIGDGAWSFQEFASNVGLKGIKAHYPKLRSVDGEDSDE